MDYPWAVPGAKCTPINDEPWALLNGAREGGPAKGDVVTIESVDVVDGEVFLTLVEWSSSDEYSADAFRPLITQSDDVAKFTHLLNTTDEVVEA